MGCDSQNMAVEELALNWLCRLGLHDWLKWGHKKQCQRPDCLKRVNEMPLPLTMVVRGLDRLLDKVSAMHAAKQQDWQTPSELFEMIEEAMGFKFTLDPCAPLENNLGTPKFYTEEDDGLKQSWEGERAFVNPPYGQLKDWVRKCLVEGRKNDTVVVALLPVRTSPKYMRLFIWAARAQFLMYLNDAQDLEAGEIGVYFLPKRVRFIDPNTGKKTGSPYFDSMVVVWR